MSHHRSVVYPRQAKGGRRTTFDRKRRSASGGWHPAGVRGTDMQLIRTFLTILLVISVTVIAVETPATTLAQTSIMRFDDPDDTFDLLDANSEDALFDAFEQ